MSQGGLLCGAGGEMDCHQFEQAVRLRLRHYTGRVLADRMVASRERQAGEGGGCSGSTAEDASAQLAVLKAVATAQDRLELAVAEIRKARPVRACTSAPSFIHQTNPARFDQAVFARTEKAPPPTHQL